MATISLKIETPSVPNYLKIIIPDQKSSPDEPSTMVSVGSLNAEQLEAVASEWKIALFKKANNQRNPKDQETKR